MKTKTQEQIPKKDLNDWGFPSSNKWQFVGMKDGVALWREVKG